MNTTPAAPAATILVSRMPSSAYCTSVIELRVPPEGTCPWSTGVQDDAPRLGSERHGRMSGGALVLPFLPGRRAGPADRTRH